MINKNGLSSSQKIPKLWNGESIEKTGLTLGTLQSSIFGQQTFEIRHGKPLSLLANQTGFLTQRTEAKRQKKLNLGVKVMKSFSSLNFQHVESCSPTKQMNSDRFQIYRTVSLTYISCFSKLSKEGTKIIHFIRKSDSQSESAENLSREDQLDHKVKIDRFTTVRGLTKHRNTKKEAKNAKNMLIKSNQELLKEITVMQETINRTNEVIESLKSSLKEEKLNNQKIKQKITLLEEQQRKGKQKVMTQLHKNQMLVRQINILKAQLKMNLKDLHELKMESMSPVIKKHWSLQQKI